MKKTFQWWFGVVSLVLTVTWVAHAQQANRTSIKGFQPGSDFVPNEILVMVNPGGKTSARPQGTSPKEWIDKIKQWIISSGSEIKIVDVYDLPAEFGSRSLPLLNGPRVCGGTLLTLRTPGRPDDVQALENAIHAVEDEIARLTDWGEYESGKDLLVVVPNNGYTKPEIMMQSTDEAKPITLTGLSRFAKKVKVAILDSGFTTRPPDPFQTLTSFMPDPVGIDTTATPPNFTSWNQDNFVSLDPGDVGTHGHGTPVARIISGIAVGSDIIPIKVCDQDGLCTGRNVTIGLCYAAYRRAQVVNASIGGFYNSKLVYEAIQDVLSEGALVVAGAGNSRNLLWNRSPEERSRETPEMSRSGDFTGALRPASDPLRGWNQRVYPAAWSSGSTAVAQGNADGIISVGSILIRSNDGKTLVSRFSSMNPSVDVVTYGEKIKISFGYGLGRSFRFVNDLRSGTSFAAPIITGIAAVLRYKNPTWSAPDVERAIVVAGVPRNYDCFLDAPDVSTSRNDCIPESARTTDERKVSVFQHEIDALLSLLGR
jgi:subtilisin family serine protease